MEFRFCDFPNTVTGNDHYREILLMRSELGEDSLEIVHSFHYLGDVISWGEG